MKRTCSYFQQLRWEFGLLLLSPVLRHPHPRQYRSRLPLNHRVRQGLDLQLWQHSSHQGEFKPVLHENLSSGSPLNLGQKRCNHPYSNVVGRT